MLVLERRRDEIITIGDRIEVLVVKIGPDRVRLGITAPLKLQIDRKEVCEAKASAALDGPDMPYETREPRPGDTSYDAAHAPQDPEPEPKPPGVTVRIRYHYWTEGSEPKGRYSWLARLDGLSGDQLSLWAKRDSNGKPFRTPEATKADCREKLTEFVSRLLPDLGPGDFEVVINFVEE
jgi:carbon storage regulator CsrA